MVVGEVLGKLLGDIPGELLGHIRGSYLEELLDELLGGPSGRSTRQYWRVCWGKMSEGCLWRGSGGTCCSRGSERSARQQHSEGVVGARWRTCQVMLYLRMCWGRPYEKWLWERCWGSYCAY